jgi:hypothetical protein
VGGSVVSMVCRSVKIATHAQLRRRTATATGHLFTREDEV